MSKLNTKSVTRTVGKTAITYNYKVNNSANGNPQFVKKSAQVLYELATTSLFGKQGMSTKTPAQQVKAIQTAIRALVIEGEYDFIANLIIHARTDMHIRTMPIVMTVEFAKALSDNRLAAANSVVITHNTYTAELDRFSYKNMRTLVRDVIQRADQITDLYAYALQVFGSKKNIPMAIKRGVADAMNKFDEYAYGKYSRDTELKFRDVLRIVHPTAKNEKQANIFAKIMGETLEVPYTWETQLSTNGQLSADKRKTNLQLWTELLMSGEVGYQALLRNMRNILQANVDSIVMQRYCLDVIRDPARVLTSKQLPFQLLQAFSAIQENGRTSSKALAAISDAIDASVVNIPQIGNRIWLILDFSGSMGNTNNNDSAITTSLMLAASLIKANAELVDNLAITMFGSSAVTIEGSKLKLDHMSVLQIARELASFRTGSISGSTNFESAVNERRHLSFAPDTILVCTDGEINKFPYTKLRELDNKAFKVTINMNHADTTPFIKENGWHELSGWSNAIFNWIPAMRESDTLVNQLSGPYVGTRTKVKTLDSEVLSSINAVYQRDL